MFRDSRCKGPGLGVVMTDRQLESSVGEQRAWWGEGREVRSEGRLVRTVRGPRSG